jgi:hypothetical protein
MRPAQAPGPGAQARSNLLHDPPAAPPGGALNRVGVVRPGMGGSLAVQRGAVADCHGPHCPHAEGRCKRRSSAATAHLPQRLVPSVFDAEDAAHPEEGAWLAQLFSKMRSQAAATRL